MKKLLCLVLSLLLLLSMAGCKKADGEQTTAPAPTEAPVTPASPSLEDFGPWVVAAEYERDSDRVRNYRYDESGNLLGYGEYEATTQPNDQGGKTVKLVPYDADGTVSTKLSKMEYIYDSDGKLVSYQRREALGDALADHVNFEYDAKGNMTKQEKFYSNRWHETITYTYDGEKLVSAEFKSSVYESAYSYVYDDEGVVKQIDFNTKYVKSGNTVKGTLVLLKSVYSDDTTYRVVLSAGGASQGVAQGKEILFYEVKFDQQGKPQYVTLELKECELFHNGYMPMRQLGAMNSVNWSGGNAKFVYKPLDVLLDQ